MKIILKNFKESSDVKIWSHIFYSVIAVGIGNGIVSVSDIYIVNVKKGASIGSFLILNKGENRRLKSARIPVNYLLSQQ